MKIPEEVETHNRFQPKWLFRLMIVMLAASLLETLALVVLVIMPFLSGPDTGEHGIVDLVDIIGILLMLLLPVSMTINFVSAIFFHRRFPKVAMVALVGAVVGSCFWLYLTRLFAF